MKDVSQSVTEQFRLKFKAAITTEQSWSAGLNGVQRSFPEKSDGEPRQYDASGNG